MHLLKFKRILRLFLIGAIGYTLLEIIWRGHTHWTMSLTGGVCFILIYFIWRRLRFAPWYRICLCCAAAVTGMEFAVGCIVNLLLGWNVWNYEQMPLHLFGQICPLFSILWFFLSALLLPLCRLLKKKGIC